MNAIVEAQKHGIVQNTGRMSAADVVQHAMVVQEVMRAVMKSGTHFGVIPGTDKPTLYQPGADVLCMTFRIAPSFQVEDLSTPDMIRYRVTCRGVHQMTGIELGSGIGEGSTSEEKYKWRKAASDKEFDAALPAMRRVKYGRSYEAKQVRTEPADVANTVLKMAAKRAKIAMVLNVTAASDMFGQDLEDLDEALRESLTGTDQAVAPPAEPQAWPADKFAAQFARWSKAIEQGLKTHDEILTFARSKGALTAEQEAQIRAVVKAPPAEGKPDPDFVAELDAGGQQ